MKYRYVASRNLFRDFLCVVGIYIGVVLSFAALFAFVTGRI
jgi:hypothetical protein